MIIITTPIVVNNIRPVQIYDWIANLTPEKYRQWDPVAHTGKIRRPVILNEGDIVYFEEFIEDYKVKFTWKIIVLSKPDTIRMKAVIPFPFYLNLSFTPINNNDTEVVHQLELGFNLFGLERIVDYFIGKTIMRKRKITAIKKHATVEFTNLEKILK